MNQTNPADGTMPSAEPPSEGGAILLRPGRRGSAAPWCCWPLAWAGALPPCPVMPATAASVQLPALGLRRGAGHLRPVLIWEARSGGYRHAADPGGQAKADIGAFVWVSAGCC
jgi:putative tricarboxylic transport membrane protein